MTDRSIAVVGLGYVGLPAALAFAREFERVLGFDIDASKVERLRAGEDPSGETEPGELEGSTLQFSSDPSDLRAANFVIVAVPTPITPSKRPDLSALRRASEMVGAQLQPGDIVVYESTVYPGVTEDICGPILEQASGLVCGRDFTLGYSPERINPGDKEHTFERVVKVVSGQDERTLGAVSEVYGAVVTAGVHRAPTIRVAESSKVIENIQRDLNIALMNELAVIFDRLDISTRDVLAAASTKWNFLRFHPGLVGGHCIGVDPYYLTAKAEELGITPQVILAGRRINDAMGPFVARATLKEMGQVGIEPGGRVAVLGLAFKENVKDPRNSRVPDIVAELADFGAEVLVHDPVVDADLAHEEYGLELVGEDELTGLAAVILAVPHAGLVELVQRLGAPVVIDVRGVLDVSTLKDCRRYWSL